MPITIRTGTLKYKKEDGTYNGFNAIAQESTDQQLASIQAAGAAQVSAVQQKGVETLESIPDDYTELSGNVADLQSAINNTVINYATYEQGSIKPTNGEPGVDSEFVRTDYISVDDLAEIYKPSSASFILFLYASDKSYLNDYKSYTSAIDYKILPSEIVTYNSNAKYFRLRGKVRGESTTTPEQYIATGTYIKSYIPVVKTVNAAKSDIENEIANLSISKQFFVLKDTTLTEGEYSYQINLDTEKYKPMILRSRAKYTGTSAPTIKCVKEWLGQDGTTYGPYYETPSYIIGGNGQWADNAWRFMPYIDGCREYITIKITVPESTTLTIQNLHNDYESTVVHRETGIRLNAHGKNGLGGPANVMRSFEIAEQLGYEACITIPKVTSDGVYVCLHNDDDIGGNVYYDDGTKVNSSVTGHPVSYFSYNDLLQFDFGIYRGYPFKGERIPKLEDFFMLCAKTGMKPMLSVHPSLDGHWNNIKAMAKNCGVLSQLGIKSNKSTIAVPMAVLGDDVESYTIDTHATTTEGMADVISYFNGYKTTYGITNARCVIEGMETAVWTDDNIALVKQAGYELSVVNTTDQALMKELIQKGVHEFTEDYNACSGLNW